MKKALLAVLMAATTLVAACAPQPCYDYDDDERFERYDDD